MLLRFINDYTQLKEVAKGVAVNGGIDVSWDIWSYVRPADGAENEVSVFYFTFHDPTTGQPEELKYSREIKTMLANVRPSCVSMPCYALGLTKA